MSGLRRLVIFLGNVKNIKSLYNKFSNAIIFKSKGNLKSDQIIEENYSNFFNEKYIPNYSNYEEFFYSPLKKVAYLDKIEVFWGKEGSGSNSDQMIPSPVTRFQNISWLKV